MEACGSAHAWARRFQRLGHAVELLPAQHVRPYVRRNKTDRADAAGLLEAARCGDIRPVPVKTPEQQGTQGLHRIREHHKAQRTAAINTVRGLLREFGFAFPAGADKVRPATLAALEDGDNDIPMALRHALAGLLDQIAACQEAMAAIEKQLAAERGLPYAFASHFAPRYLHQALRIYRENFRPSAVLDKPYAMIGVPLIAAPSDEEAEFLATSAYQRVLALMRGESLVLRPPVESMAGRWQPHEQAAVGDFLGLAVIGGPQKVRARLEVLLEQTGADELIFTCDLYQPEHRLRSFEIAAGLR